MSMPLHNQNHGASNISEQLFRPENNDPKPLSVAYLSPVISTNQEGRQKTTVRPGRKSYLRAYIHEPIDGLYWIVGTENWADVRLSIEARKEFHFVIERENDSWLLHSQENTAPLFVNGEPIHIAWIEDGDTISIGKFSFVFNITHRN